MTRGDSFRDFMRQLLIFLVVISPVVVWLAFSSAAGEWDKSIRKLLDATATLKQELPEHSKSLSEHEREEYKYLLDLIEETNPILLGILFIAMVTLYLILFLLSLVVFLLYLFFGLYLVHRRAPTISGSYQA